MTLPVGREFFLDLLQVDGQTGGAVAELMPGDLTGEGMISQVEESGSALDIGKRFGASDSLLFEDLPGSNPPFESANRFFQVVLARRGTTSPDRR